MQQFISARRSLVFRMLTTYMCLGYLNKLTGQDHRQSSPGSMHLDDSRLASSGHWRRLGSEDVLIELCPASEVGDFREEGTARADPIRSALAVRMPPI